MKHFLLATSSLLFAASAWAQSAAPVPAYEECTALASTNPADALTKADAWMNFDKSIPAQHCRAMALYGLSRFTEAADTLAVVRERIARDNAGMRTTITLQAAQAYNSANHADKALAILSTQIDELSNTRGDNASIAAMTSDLLLERAKLNTNYGKLNDAAKDLDHAVSLTPLNEAVLLARASVFEKLGDKTLARSDAQNVLKLNASNAEARALFTRVGGVPEPLTSLAPAAGAAKKAPKPKAATVPAVEVQ